MHLFFHMSFTIILPFDFMHELTMGLLTGYMDALDKLVMDFGLSLDGCYNKISCYLHY